MAEKSDPKASQPEAAQPAKPAAEPTRPAHPAQKPQETTHTPSSIPPLSGDKPQHMSRVPIKGIGTLREGENRLDHSKGKPSTDTTNSTGPKKDGESGGT